MAMGKYRIKETSTGDFIVLYLKDYGNGFSWEQISRKYDSKEAAQAFIDAEKGADNEKNK